MLLHTFSVSLVFLAHSHHHENYGGANVCIGIELIMITIFINDSGLEQQKRPPAFTSGNKR